MLKRHGTGATAKILSMVLLKAAIAPILFDGVYSIYEGKVSIHFAPIVFPFALVAVAYEEWWSRRNKRQSK